MRKRRGLPHYRWSRCGKKSNSVQALPATVQAIINQIDNTVMSNDPAVREVGITIEGVSAEEASALTSSGAYSWRCAHLPLRRLKQVRRGRERIASAW